MQHLTESFPLLDLVSICPASGALLKKSLKPKGVFQAFAYGPIQVKGPEAVRQLVLSEEKLWEPFRDKRVVAWRLYNELLAECAVFSLIQPYTFEVTTYLCRCLCSDPA